MSFKISRISPSYQQGHYLHIAITSVLKQNAEPLECIVIAGGSTDESKEVLKRFEHHLFYCCSEADKGQSHTLIKGFAKASGDVMGWINGDDLLHPGALRVIADIFEQFPEVEWLQGYPTVIDTHGSIVYHRNPVKSADFFYNGGFESGCFIQQESTFWRRSLWDKAGGYLDKEYHLAADFELWMRFFRHAKMYTIDALLGAFRFHEGAQLSRANHDTYMQQCRNVIAREKKWGLVFQQTGIACLPS